MVMAEVFTAIFIFILGLISLALSIIRKKAIVWPVLAFGFFIIGLTYSLSIPSYGNYALNFIIAAVCFMFGLIAFIRFIRFIFEILK